MDEQLTSAVHQVVSWLGPPVAVAVAWLARRVQVLEARVVELHQEHAECRSQLASLRARLGVGGALALALALFIGGCSATPDSSTLQRVRQVRQVSCSAAVPACGVVRRLCGGGLGEGEESAGAATPGLSQPERLGARD